MKLGGKVLNSLNIETLVIPRGDGDDLVFKFQAVLDYNEFDEKYPIPEPLIRTYPGGRTEKDTESNEYKERLNTWAEKKAHWMFLKSISATPDLVWETIDMANSDTWVNYMTELQTAGFTPPEIARMVITATSACGLNQDKIDEATKRFLAGPGTMPKGQSSPSTEQVSTPSGDAANGSA